MKKRWLLAGCALSVFLLAACGNGGDATETATPEAETQDLVEGTESPLPDNFFDDDGEDDDDVEEPDELDVAKQIDEILGTEEITDADLPELSDQQLIVYASLQTEESDSTALIDELLDRFVADPEEFLIALATNGGLNDMILNDMGAKIAEHSLAGDASYEQALTDAAELDLAIEAYEQLEGLTNSFTYWSNQL